MNCLTCAHSDGELREGDKVRLSDWEQDMLGKEMRGTIIQFGHKDTLRRNTAKVEWRNGHKDQWWPVNMLIKEQAQAAGGEVFTP